MSIISTAFRQYRFRLVHYVNARVGDYDVAEDIVQDAFVRVLEMNVGVREESVKHLLYVACRNLVFDYLRRHLLSRRTAEYLNSTLPVCEESTLHQMTAREIAEHELRIVCSMPCKRAQVYRLSHYEGKRIEEIAEHLCISPRTVEAHLFAGRKEVREKMRIFAS